MKKIKLFSIYFFILLLNRLIGQGLIFDEGKFEKGEQFKISRADKYPDSFSLKKYTPYVFEQHNATCVAHSIAVARTIAFAYSNEISNKDEISANAFSPHWVYYRNRERNDHGCSKGLNIEKAMNDLINHGIAKLTSVEFPSYYPFTENVLCDDYPTDMEKDTKEAYSYSVSSVYRIKSLVGVKLALSKGMPVIAALKIPQSFKNIKGHEVDMSCSSSDPSLIGHSVVVVGYNDLLGYIEIMNSWGKEWGCGGFTRLSYKIFENILIGCYALHCKNNQILNYSNARQKKKGLVINSSNISTLQKFKVSEYQNIQFK